MTAGGLYGERIDPVQVATNKSSSKQTHDFGKAASRFKIYTPGTEHVNHQIGYNLPSTLKSNRISFGKGERRKPSLDNPRDKTPDPTAYEITSDFNKTAKVN